MRYCGAYRSENDGISNYNGSENLPHRKPKVSPATIFDGGLAGPKTRPKGVADGQQVNIPVLHMFRPNKAGASIFSALNPSGGYKELM